ncbi:uncharacterized protein LOC142656162 isoform X2 [Rhinoderma darwinii]|uniref:uncharacterized protein LOC142656162 isoform X2 n=1 Tax=Rhinoderma darwinii TaxID=43563 RepID=UPI003F66860A
MDLLEQFLAGDDENLCSFTMGELEKIVQLLSNQVRTHREQLNETKTEVENLEAETAERSSGRELLASRAAHTVDLQEALEEEEKTQQQLQTVTHEMERLSGVLSSESCEALETQLKKVEDLLFACCQREKSLLEEVQSLKTSLTESQAALGQTTVEHQTVEKELLAVQNGLTARNPGHDSIQRKLPRSV